MLLRVTAKELSIRRKPFFYNQEADDLSVRAANEKKFGLLDEANNKRSEATEIREAATEISKSISTQNERLKSL